MSKNSQYKGLPDKQKRAEVNSPLVNMIKSALDALDNGYQRPKDSYGADYKYLLNQSIRQYLVPESNLHVTEEADKLWKALGIKENILFYKYQDSICPTQTMSSVKTCKGPSKVSKSEDIVDYKKIPFNLLFIEEHTTPVSDVIKALKEAYYPDPKEQTIVDVLDKMHITKMRKTENIAIKLSSNRILPDDYNDLDAIGIFNKIIQDNNVNYPQILF